MSVFEDSLAPRTRFDWNFRLGDIAVRVHPFFWLTTVLLGLGGRDTPFGERLLYLPVWLAIVFVSILVHELGHVLMGRYFGSRGHIILTGFCGLAVGSAELPARWQRNVVSLAGPGAGFLLAAVVTGVSYGFYPAYTLAVLSSLFGILVSIGPGEMPPNFVDHVVFTALWINIFWGLVNLLPIWPLDGGQVSREICAHFQGREGMRLSLMISLVTASGLAILALVEMFMRRPLIPYLSFGGTLFPVLFFGLLAVQSWQLLRFIRYAGPDWEREEEEPRQPWEQDADWWKHGGKPWDD